jgi:uncharacterized protein (DUF736 family)
MNKNPKVKIGSAWRKQTKIGEVISGTFGAGVEIILMPTEKKHDKSPDFAVYIRQKEQRQSVDGNSTAGRRDS